MHSEAELESSDSEADQFEAGGAERELRHKRKRSKAELDSTNFEPDQLEYNRTPGLEEEETEWMYESDRSGVLESESENESESNQPNAVPAREDVDEEIEMDSGSGAKPHESDPWPFICGK